MSLRIVLTGGGTAGHVIPNIALIQVLQKEGWQIDYIGSAKGIEKAMITALKIPFHSVSSGKFRRYFSLKNLLDPFKILLGIIQAWHLLRKLKPNVVFSKGGFVAFPVVVGAWLNRIPVVAHESDMSPGLANRLSFPFANKICVNFAAAKKYFKHQEKVVVTGTPIRQQLFEGQVARGLERCGFSDEKPCLLIVGGSQGASALNQCVRQALPRLCQQFQIIHLCGKGKVDFAFSHTVGYCQIEYADDELADIFAASELVISRAGANALCEILALAKPHVLIPLSEKVSRGDQIQNARYFQQQEISVVIPEEKLTPDTLLAAIEDVLAKKIEKIEKMKALSIESATMRIIAVINEEAHAQS